MTRNQMAFAALLGRASPIIGIAITLFLISPGVGTASDNEAMQRIIATETAAIELSPGLVAMRASVEARSAETRATAAAGVPYMEVQQEGVGSGFDRQPNAQTTLRIGTPFNMPSHARARRELENAAEAWVEAADNKSILETTAEVGERWLDLAAAEGRLAVVRRRLLRLEKALNLQRVRLELGEVAGTDVTQIELAWAGAFSTFSRLEADREMAEETLRRYCGDRCVLPLPGDLAAIRKATITLDALKDVSSLLDASPMWLAQDLRAAVDLSGAQVMERTAWGRPEAELEWEHIPGLDGLGSFDAFGVRLRFPLPTGSSGSRTKEAATARKIQAEADLRVERARLKAQMAGATASVRAAERTLDRLETILEKIEGSEHSLAEQFRLGAISYLVFIDGVARFDDIRLEAINAGKELLSQRLALAVLTADSRYFPIPELGSESDSTTEENQ